jgi:dihydropteroate synthase
MAGVPKISFRILRPSPLQSEIEKKIQIPSDYSFEVDFPRRRQSLRLYQTLRCLPGIKFLQARAKPFPLVIWSQSQKEAENLPEILGNFPELSTQIKTGLRNHLKGSRWNFAGLKKKKFSGGAQTQIMGILNITPDSFSDGGEAFSLEKALERARQMQAEGADWIDIGGESTRPGARAVSAMEEKKRILPVIRLLSKKIRLPISVDTYKAETARAAVGEGAQMVNDIGSLRLDRRMGSTLAKLKVPVVLMHMKGKPRTMQKKPAYGEVVGEILAFFRERISLARDCGISEERILLDPGFGFGKTAFHNVEITRRLWEFRVLGRPLVLGPSRKSTLGFLLGGLPPDERLEATSAMVTAAVLRGADFVRVHDVQSMARVVKIADAIRNNRGLTLP